MIANTSSIKHSSVIAFVAFASLISGCSTPLTETQQVERQKNRSIYDFLKSDSRIKYSQDSKGNTVTYQSDSYLTEGAYQTYRGNLSGFSANCIANGGKFDIEAKGKNNLGNVISQVHSASLYQAASTYEFWKNLGVNGTADAMDVYYQQSKARMEMAESVAFIFDSAVRTESVGTFTCTDVKTTNVKWRLNRDLYSVRKGYRSPTGMYVFPDAYTSYITDTVVIYEKQSYATTQSGFTKLPENSKDLIYPTSGYYVVIEQTGGKWKILSAKHFISPAGKNSTTLTLSPNREKANQEILIVSEDGNFVVPAYRDTAVRFTYSESYTGRNACHIDRIADKMNYTICSSAFGDEPQEYSTTAKIVGTIFSPDPNTQYNLKLTRTVGFMPDAFWAAINQANVKAGITR